LNRSLTKTVFTDFIGLFFPKYCRGCEDALVHGEELICTKCILEMPRSNYHLEKENPFYKRINGRIPVKYVMTLFKFVKGSRVQHVLHSLKYKNQPELGNLLGRVYGADLKKSGYEKEFDLIIPVPIHISRRRKRGYNQSDEFGKGLSEILNIASSDEVMARRSKTDTQTKKSKLGRWENVSEGFKVVKPDIVHNKRILLVDDVMTTGATLEACGRLIVDAGCRELSIACIASTQ
jgi:ComF family protein